MLRVLNYVVGISLFLVVCWGFWSLGAAPQGQLFIALLVGITAGAAVLGLELLVLFFWRPQQ